jgi:hypothetical protein
MPESPPVSYLRGVWRECKAQYQNLAWAVTHVSGLHNRYLLISFGGLLSLEPFRHLIVPQILLLGLLVRAIEPRLARNDPSLETGGSFDFADGRRLLRRGIDAWILWTLYTFVPIIIAYASTVQREDTILELLDRLPFVGNLSAIQYFFETVERVELASRVLGDAEEIRGFAIVLAFLYVVPASIALLAESSENSLYHGLSWERVRPVIFSQSYVIGWVFASPLLFGYQFGPRTVNSYFGAYLDSEPYWEVLLFTELIIVPVISFYLLLVAFYTIAGSVRDTRRRRLQNFAERIVQIFEDPSNGGESGRQPTESPPRPSLEWLETSLATRDAFDENSGQLTAWIRRILPEDVMYELRVDFDSYYASIGAPIPARPLTKNEAEIPTVHGPVEIVVWYA